MLGVDLSSDRDHRRPTYRPSAVDVPDENKGLVLVSMFSMSCESRGNPGRRPNKMLPWDKWRPLLDLLGKAYPENKIRLLGAKEDKVPEAAGLPISEQSYLTGVPVPYLANIMMHAKCLVTVDNGMGHLAAAVGLNEFLLAPACLPLSFIVPHGHPGLRLVHMDPAEVDAEWIKCELSSAIESWETQVSIPA
jgi:ADP-heptose:LPS heptosyltransferase